jgi:hypothetical protein
VPRQDAREPPERVGLREQRRLPLRHGDGDPPLGKQVVALALIAMMVGVQHPLEVTHAGLGQVVEDAARTEVDQEPPVAVLEEVDVAGVPVPVRTG